MKKIFEQSRVIMLLLLSISIFSTLLISCGDEEIKKEDAEQVGLPPSITDEGKTVKKIVRLSEDQSEELNIKTFRISKKITNYTITVPGFVFPAPDNISIISAPLDGRVAKIYAHEGERINKGELLLELESLEYGNLVAEYLQANADQNYQDSKLKRIKSLYEKKISSKSDLDKAEAEYTRANAILRAAYSKLKAVGTSENEIDKMVNSSDINPRLKIVAPISGTIDQHLIDLGQSVIAYEKMLSIIDLKKVLIRGYVSPEDAPELKEGSKIKVSQKNNPAKLVEGKISTINPALDENNKSIVINSVINTVNNWPKPGENLRVEITAESLEPVISIPISAVAYDADESVVFVNNSKNMFEQQPVKISKIYDQWAIVSSGLKENDEIAINQIFSLKALLRFEDYAEE